jgi:hypothetical protein
MLHERDVLNDKALSGGFDMLAELYSVYLKLEKCVKLIT